MFGIRAVLIGAVLGILIWFLRSRNASSVRAAKKLALIFISGFAVVAVLYPDLTDAAASLLGVGRGADLLLYFVTVAFLFMSLSGYLRSLDAELRFVELAREVTILRRRIDDLRGDGEQGAL